MKNNKVNTEALKKVLTALPQKTVLVVGDVMLDRHQPAVAGKPGAGA